MVIKCKYMHCTHCSYAIPVGFGSNGEFNSMRNRGYTRPISVFCIRSRVRARLSESTMLAMLTPKGILPLSSKIYYKRYCFPVCANQLIVPEKPNSVVPPSLLCQVLLWRSVQSLSWDDIISRLRSRTVPSGYVYHAWKDG